MRTIQLLLLSGVLFCLTFMLLVSCSVPSHNVAPKQVERLTERIGTDALRMICCATAARVTAKGAQPVVLTAQEWHRLRGILLNDRSYEFDLQKRTPFRPEYTLWLERDTQSIPLKISVHSAQIEFLDGVVLDCDPSIESIAQLLHVQSL